MKSRIVVLLFLLMAVSLYSSGDYPDFSVRVDPFARFESFLPTQVSRLGTVYHIVQDRTGYLWFGGIRGLGRFDGSSLKCISMMTGTVPCLITKLMHWHYPHTVSCILEPELVFVAITGHR